MDVITVFEQIQSRRLKERTETGVWPSKMSVPNRTFEELRANQIDTLKFAHELNGDYTEHDLFDLQTTKTLYVGDLAVQSL